MTKKILASILVLFSLQAVKINFKKSLANNNGKGAFSIKFEPSPNEAVYYDSLHISSNVPEFKIENWKINNQPVEQFDEQYKKTKRVFTQPFSIKGTVSMKAKCPDASLAISYLTNKMTAPEYKFFNFVDNKTQKAIKKVSPPITQKETPEKETIPTCATPHQKRLALSDYVQKLFATTSSLWLRFLLILILGILMSLTPCIYPMIPITVGLLQSQARKSVWYNFSLALSYTFGIALMFAILGLTAAVTGGLFGKLMSKPIVVILIVLVLLYLALSMFGFYEMKAPRFLTRQQTQLRPTGSLISAFAFGFISGTIASPCLTPGLAFLLTFVAHTSNKLLGFMFMFTFGVGMSIPLLLIGTFSTSLKFIPKTGMWMLEVKKIFGILLLALCFYYLSNILSLTILMWLIATTLLALGLYYLLTFRKQSDRFTRHFRFAIAVTALIGSGSLYFASINRTINPPQSQELINWRNNYAQAKKEAKQTQKIIFLDVGAPYCSICKAIDRCIFNEAFIASLINEMIPVKIDAANSPEYEELAKKFKIIGVPTILAIDPQKETILKRWGSELYTMTKQEISSIFSKLLKEYR